MRCRVIARHNRWVEGASITELTYDDHTYPTNRRRFVATIRGYRNWMLFDGYLIDGVGKMIQARATAIRDRIDAGDELVFTDKWPWAPEWSKITKERHIAAPKEKKR